MMIMMIMKTTAMTTVKMATKTTTKMIIKILNDSAPRLGQS